MSVINEVDIFECFVHVFILFDSLICQMVNRDEQSTKKAVGFSFEFHSVITFVIKFEIEQVFLHQLGIFITQSISVLKILSILNLGLLSNLLSFLIKFTRSSNLDITYTSFRVTAASGSYFFVISSLGGNSCVIGNSVQHYYALEALEKLYIESRNSSENYRKILICFLHSLNQ